MANLTPELVGLNTPISWSKKSEIFCGEISDLSRQLQNQIVNRKNIQLKSARTNNVLDFKFAYIDDAGEGEIAGWNYKAKCGSKEIRLLIIND